MEITPTLTAPQAKFLNLSVRFGLLVSGFGGGKTWGGCAKLCRTAWENPGARQGYFGPTHSHTRDIFFPTIEEVAEDWGLDARIYPANREVELYRGSQLRSVIICRSMDRPDAIVGFKLARAIVDEIDTMPMLKAKNAWRKIIARLRQDQPGLENGADVTTTPEGFGFVWDMWVKSVREKPELAKQYGMVRCSTYDNAHNLPPGYIESMEASYPPNLIDAYLHGQFVNLTTGTVYREYDRKKNNSTEIPEDREPLYVGMDFNIGNMSAIVHVKRDGRPHAVDELVGAFDTPEIIQRIKEKYWPYIDGDYRRTRPIKIYPDASGRNRTRVGAGMSDIQLLEQAKFIVDAPQANPPVRDRVNAMNAMFCNAKNERKYFINAERCPVYAENLEQQAYDSGGEPDKQAGKDHTNDAGGYFIHRVYPVQKPASNLNIRFAI